MEINDLMEKATRFHGHICPGLAIGVLAVKYVLEQGFNFSPNEEVVAVVENLEQLLLRPTTWPIRCPGRRG